MCFSLLATAAGLVSALHCVYIVLGKCEASAVWKKEVSAGCVSMAIQLGQQLYGCQTSETEGPLNVIMQSATSFRFWFCVFN